MIYQERWNHKYKGIPIEILCTHREPSPYLNYSKGWCFYLHLAIEQFPEDVRERLISKQTFSDFGTPFVDYHDNPLCGLNWHCDMTYYSKEWNEDSVLKMLKVGCDYQHYYDEGRHDLYDSVFVKNEAQDCVDSLFALYPTLKTMDELWDEHRAKFPGDKK